MAKRIEFFDGAQSSTVPTIGNIVASNLIVYADDAAYEAAEQGSPAEGNLYYNSTLDVIRYYNGTQWVSVVDEVATQTVQNKTIDGTDATGTNTISIDATDASYDNSTSGLVATDVQAAIDENEGRIEAAEQDIVDLETLSGSPGATHHGFFTGSTIPDNSDTREALQALETGIENKIDVSEKGAANGVATLDSNSRLPASQLPTSATEYKGAWNANTNSPTLADGVGTNGDLYRTSVAGSQDLGSGSETYGVGDAVIYNGTIWEKIPADDQVTSVNGQSGVVVLTTTDVAEGTNEYYTNAKADDRIAAASIDDLSDVDTTTSPPSNGQALIFNSGSWEPGASGSGTNIATESSSFTAVINTMHLVNTSSGDVTATLPAAASNSGQRITFKVTDDTNKLIIDGNASETIDGATTFELRSNDESVTILCDGSNWQIIDLTLNEILSANSSAFRLDTAGYATGEWAQLTGNTVELNAGTWQLFGYAECSDFGANPSFDFNNVQWALANGNNTSSLPTPIVPDHSTGSISGDRVAQSQANENLDSAASHTVIYTVTSPTDVYLNIRQFFNTAADGQLYAGIIARRIK